MGARGTFHGTSVLSRVRVVVLTTVLVATFVAAMVPVSVRAVDAGHSRIVGSVTADGLTPLVNVQVRAYSYTEAGGWTWVGGAQSRVDGSFDVAGLAAGTYRLWFNPVQDEYPNKWYGEQYSVNTATDVVVGSASTVSGMDIDMTPGALSGRATSALGIAAPDVVVDAYASTGWGWEWVGSTVTAGDGAYVIDGLCAGTYRLAFADSYGYLGEAYGDVESVWAEGATDVEVMAGGTTSGIDVQLAAAAHVVGVVTNDGVTGIPGIRVVAYRVEGEGLLWEGEDETGASGAYALGGIPSGQYLIYFWDPSGAYGGEYHMDTTHTATAEVLTVTAPDTAQVDEDLFAYGTRTQAYRVQGTVTFTGGAPAPNVDVRAYLFRDGVEVSGAWWDGETDANGDYDIGGIPALTASETLRVGFFDPDGSANGGTFPTEYWMGRSSPYVADDVVFTDPTYSTVNETLPAGTLRGTVTDGVSGLSSVTVYAYAPDGVISATTVTGTDGGYTFANLAPAQYRLLFNPLSERYGYEYSGDAASLSTATPVSVNNGGSTVFNSVLTEFGRISGRVTSDGISGIADVAVTVLGDDGAGGWMYSGWALTGADGSYMVERLVAGSYRLSFEPPWALHYGPEFHLDASSVASATPVDVVMGAETSGVDEVLDPTCAIAGTVTDGARAVSHVTVTAHRSDGIGGWAPASSDMAEADGSFMIPRLAPGTYRIEVTDGSSWNNDEYLTVWFGGSETLDGATDVVVAAPGVVTVNPTIVAASRIRGSVRAADGMPLSGITVSLASVTGDKPFAWTLWETTAADGSYEFAVLDSDTYRVGFVDLDGMYLSEYWDDQPTSNVATAISLGAAEVRGGVDATLAVAGHITGSVTDESGAPLGGVSVTALRETQNGWAYIWSNSTEADGSYDVGKLDSGTYRVKFVPGVAYGDEWYDDAAGPGSATDVTVTVGQVTASIDATLSWAGAVSGTVMCSAGPVQGVCVNAAVPDGSGGWEDIESGYSDASGAYSITGLRPGTYRIRFCDRAPFIEEYWSDANDASSGLDVTVAAGATTTGIDAFLETPGSVSGQVTMDGVTGVSDRWVYLQKYDGAGSWDLVGYLQTAADGVYEFTGVRPGTYRVHFWGDALFGDQWWQGSGSADSATPIVVGRGEHVTGIDAILAEPNRISGHVTLPGGAGVPSVYVALYSWDEAGSYWATVAGDTTDLDGGYEITGITSGVYRVGFWPTSALPEYYDDAWVFDDSTEITVSGITSGIDAVVDMPATIRGAVSSGGSPVAGVTVRAYVRDRIGDWSLARSMITGADGAYEFSELRAAPHRIEFVGDDTYFGEWYSDASSADSATVLSLASGSVESGVDAALVRSGAISGSVSDTSGPLADVFVEAYVSDGEGGWNWEGYAFSDAGGAYRISGLHSGAYRVRFNAPDGRLSECWNDVRTLDTASDILVVEGSDTGPIDAYLADAGAVSGTVTSDGSTGIEGVAVNVYEDTEQGWGFVGSTVSGPAGAYTVTGLYSGTYRVEFEPTGMYLGEVWADANTLDAGTDVGVSAGAETGGIDAILSLGGSVTGKVTSDGSTGIEGVVVSLSRPDGSGGWEYVAQSVTGSDGAYGIGGLQSGTYVAYLWDPSGRYLSEYHSDASSYESATQVAVAAGSATSGVDELLEAAGSVAGTLHSFTGSVLGDASVHLYLGDGSGGWEWCSSTSTLADGTWLAYGLRAGTYRIRFSHPDCLSEYWDDAADLMSATDVLVSAGGYTGGVDATLSAGAMISGTVTSEAGAIAGVWVTVNRPAEGGTYEWVNSVVTGSDGGYTVSGLAAGTYSVWFDGRSANHSSEWYDDAATFPAATSIVLGEGESRTGVSAVLDRLGDIRGTVTSDGAIGISGVSVSVFASDGSGGWFQIGNCFTDANGAYVAPGLATGTYRVLFEDESGVFAPTFYPGVRTIADGADVVVTAGATTGGVDVRMSPGGHIAGTVSDGIAAIAGVNVFAASPDGMGGWDFSTPAVTGADGTFEITGLATGAYRILFLDYEGVWGYRFHGGGWSLADATEVLVTEGSTIGGIDATLTPASAITGVVSEGTTRVADVWVSAYVPDGLGGWIPVSGAQTDESGSYTLGGLAAGEYRIEFIDLWGDRAPSYYSGAQSLEFASAVAVGTAATVSGIDVDYAVVPDDIAPVSSPDTATVGEDTTLSVSATSGVLANDFDADEDPLVAVLVNDVAHGTLDLLADGSYTYRPEPDFFGTDAFSYRADDGVFMSAAATVTITVVEVPETPGRVVWTSSATPTISIGATFTLSGTLLAGDGPAAGRSVVLESSSGGTTFKPASAQMTTGAGGTFSFVVRPSARMFYRVRYAGDSTYAPVISEVVTVSVAPRVGDPRTPSQVAAGQKFTTGGSFAPFHSGSLSIVRVYRFRYVAGKWRSEGYVSAPVRMSRNGVVYSAAVSLPVAGRWRLRAYVPADAGHTEAWSQGFGYVTVR